MTLAENLNKLSNEDLLRLTNELRQTTVAEDALIRQVIKGTEQDTTAPMIAFIAVQGALSFVLADRLIAAEQKFEAYRQTRR